MTTLLTTYHPSLCRPDRRVLNSHIVSQNVDTHPWQVPPWPWPWGDAIGYRNRRTPNAILCHLTPWENRRLPNSNQIYMSPVANFGPFFLCRLDGLTPPIIKAEFLGRPRLPLLRLPTYAGRWAECFRPFQGPGAQADAECRKYATHREAGLITAI